VRKLSEKVQVATVRRLLHGSSSPLARQAIEALSEAGTSELTVGYQNARQWAPALELAYSLRAQRGSEVFGLDAVVAALKIHAGRAAAVAVPGRNYAFLIVMDEGVTQALGVLATQLAD
jgi:hypothetical protein